MDIKRIIEVSEASPAFGYALVTNANPLTGIPCILGEFAPSLDDLNTFGKPWHQIKVAPVQKLSHQNPALFQQITCLVQATKQPTQFLLNLHPKDIGVVKKQKLELSPTAALRYFYTLLQDAIISPEEFLQAIPIEVLTQEQAYLDLGCNNHLTFVTQGIPISGMIAKGILVKNQADLGTNPDSNTHYVLLVDRIEAHHTTLLYEQNCAGVIALRGSPADHFALLSRERNFPYTVLEGHWISDEGLHCPSEVLPFGTLVTIEFHNGKIYRGDGVISQRVVDPAIAKAQQLLNDCPNPYPLRLNLDTVDDVFGSLPADVSGIGLVRTEHLLRRSNREGTLRQLLESDDLEVQDQALIELSSFFQQEFVRFLALAQGLPITFRLLDYPLHELGCNRLAEVNPMLGLRGVRQGIQYPPLYQAQIEAILTAAIAAQQQGVPVHCVEIMIPLVSLVEEIRLVRQWVRQYQDALLPSKQLAVKLGAMIETPAAALSSDLLAKECDFLSFGTNDLTQLALGLSREDYPPVLRAYQQQDLLEKDPFQTLHPTVFQFIRDAAVRAKQTNSSIAIGICGSHATNSQMIELCKEGLVDYLSIPQQRLLQVKLQSIQSL